MYLVHAKYDALLLPENKFLYILKEASFSKNPMLDGTVPLILVPEPISMLVRLDKHPIVAGSVP
jgi:hypothetical protein